MSHKTRRALSMFWIIKSYFTTVDKEEGKNWRTRSDAKISKCIFKWIFIADDNITDTSASTWNPSSFSKHSERRPRKSVIPKRCSRTHEMQKSRSGKKRFTLANKFKMSTLKYLCKSKIINSSTVSLISINQRMTLMFITRISRFWLLILSKVYLSTT